MPTFKQNTGEAMIRLSSFANISSIEMSIQEGKYIDERIGISISNVDTAINMFKFNKSASE